MTVKFSERLANSFFAYKSLYLDTAAFEGIKRGGQLGMRAQVA